MENQGDKNRRWMPLPDNSTNDRGINNSLIVVGSSALIPAFIAAGGEKAGYAFIDFFTAQIRNRNTRAAYAVAVRAFFDWCGVKRLTLATLRTHHVAAYIEWLGKRYEAPSSTSPRSACSSIGWWCAR